MSQILDVYKDIKDHNHRFVNEIFDEEIYKEAVPKLTVIDLGAFEGEFGFYIYNAAKDIYCFEPDPKPYATLERRIKEFDVPKMHIYPIAMSNENGKTMFYASGAGGSYMIGYGDQVLPKDDQIEVETITLATFMNQNKIEHVDILKVDIEGGETPVFESKDFADVAGKIDLIIGEHLASVKGLLESFGFKAIEAEGHNTIYKR